MLTTFESLVKDPLLYEHVFSKKVKHEQKKYPANHKIILQGDNIPSFYYILSGSVRIVVRKKFRRQNKLYNASSILGKLGPNDIFGLFSMFDDEAAGADLITDVESEIIEIDKKSFMKFLNSEPDFGYKLMYDIAFFLVKKLRASNDTLMEVTNCAIALQNQSRLVAVK